MSVIVKGMEMPESCSDCPLHDGETGRCNILRITVCDYIPKVCPLVELVECEDCKYSKCTDESNYDCYHCELTTGRVRFAGCFCNRGKRREEK